MLVTDPSIVWLCKGVRFSLRGCAITFSHALMACMHLHLESCPVSECSSMQRNGCGAAFVNHCPSS